MGITGLIKFLGKASSDLHLKDIRGSTVVVDTYCWLHKGAFGCAEKLARGEDTDQYMQYCMKYVELLLSYDIKPILVFDGRHLPAKELTERRRRESRKQSREMASALLRAGDKEGARSHMRRCVDVTHEMALRVIRECRLRNVDCIVAPYEADAQMAWLNKIGVAQYVITEDSDLTLFGANKIIFKLDLNGTGSLVEADKFYLAMGCKRENYNFEKFRRMCILSGCDYLDSLPGIGLMKACKFILMTEQDDMWKALRKIPAYLKMKNLQVDDEYIEQFHKAEATFKHMFIYNPFERRMERLNELTENSLEGRYCSNAGVIIDDQERALQLALGNLNPFTFKQLDNWHPDRNYGFAQVTNNKIKRAKHKSIWQEKYQAFSNGHISKDVVKDDKCALDFRTVDFSTKFINEEITENARAERAKPEEAEIFSMYQYKATELEEPSAKRRRYSSESNNDYADEQKKSEATQNVVLTHNNHNPFAKLQCMEVAKSAKTVCENSSLLKILSPKKASCEANLRKNFPLKSPKSPLDRLQETAIVKSRFFSNNVNEVSRIKKNVSRDLTAEINSIEKQSYQKEEKLALLYDSPSPKKNLLGEFSAAMKNEKNFSIIKKEHKSCVNDDEVLEEDVTSTCALKLNTSFIAGDIIDNECKNSIDNAITISDEEDNDNSKYENSSQTITPTAQKSNNSTMFFKSQEKQRLGLTRTKSKSTLKAQKTNGKSKSNSTITTTTAMLQSQTRLTMFGFQKRPTLK
ncbi:PREDICTED: exonuclease 1 [Bactrocera latifrons]|uniref:exonuclease 1 n=1 Tax=Bactrocera latifrons TaxID=174628 RepID=UPI0008DE6109|nr:PREDICTED: exonuclease 1 [Bactrocera latifrons]